MEQAIVTGYNDASRLFMEDKLDAALVICHSLLKVAPGNCAVLNLAGSTLYRKNMLVEAEALLSVAVAIAPGTEEVVLNLVRVLRQQKRTRRAINTLEQGLACTPESARMLSTLGEILYYDRQFDAAVKAFERLVELDPTNVDALFRLACSYQECDMTKAAFDAYGRILKTNPNHSNTHVNLAQIYKSLGEHEHSLELFQRATDLAPHDSSYSSRAIFCMNYSFTSGEQFLETAVQWAAAYTDPLTKTAQLPRRAKRTNGRVGLGFLSADFTRHPVGKLFLPVLKRLNRNSFDIHCFSNVQIEDEMTASYRSVTPNFHPINELDDADAYDLIKNQDIDILVDLSGHSNGNRPGVLARRASPVQIMWLGYFNTTGMRAIDYVLADAVNIPPEQEKYYQERVLRLADSFFPYAPSVRSPLPPKKTDGPISFGCFNDSGKINNTVLKAWASILHRAPDSRLILKSKTFSDQWVRNHFLDRAIHQGMPVHRILFLGPSDFDQYLRDYAKVDIALDPFPYSGGATTADALSMGVPVLTCPFDSFGSRLSSSILTACDMNELICSDVDDYIDRAIRLTTNPGLLSATTEKLRRSFPTTRLCDVDRFTQNFQEVLLGTIP